MSNKKLVEEHFSQEVASHTMTVLLAQGLYRHLRFAKGDSSTMAFDLLTYPGGLMIRGDMGCFVFERTEDMFGFFRDDGKGRRINENYWAERVRAESIWGYGIRTYNQEEARADVEADLSNTDDLSQEGYDAIMEYLGSAFDSEEELRNAMVSWDENGDYRDEFQFDTSAGRELRYFTTNYLWCLHAIVWGIEQYDKTKENP